MIRDLKKAGTVIQLIIGVVLGFLYLKVSIFSDWNFYELFMGTVMNGRPMYFIVSIIIFLLTYLFTKFKVLALSFFITTTALYLAGTLILLYL